MGQMEKKINSPSWVNYDIIDSIKLSKRSWGTEALSSRSLEAKYKYWPPSSKGLPLSWPWRICTDLLSLAAITGMQRKEMYPFRFAKPSTSLHCYKRLVLPVHLQHFSIWDWHRRWNGLKSPPSLSGCPPSAAVQIAIQPEVCVILLTARIPCRFVIHRTHFIVKWQPTSWSLSKGWTEF